MKNIFILVSFFFICSISNAQFIKNTSIEVSLGYGLSSPYDDVDILGTGFYAQGEYVMEAFSWLDFRPYAGFIFTGQSANQTLPDEFKATSSAFLFGGKFRLTAPIPYIAPYFELGLGGSLGKFETITPFTNKSKSGFLVHTPVSLGLELGKEKRTNVELTYYFHNSVEQVIGAFAIGFSIPLD